MGVEPVLDDALVTDASASEALFDEASSFLALLLA